MQSIQLPLFVEVQRHHNVANWDEASQKLRDLIGDKFRLGTGNTYDQDEWIVTHLDAWSGEGRGYYASQHGTPEYFYIHVR